MPVELDHVFICCAEGAPEASALLAHGFIEGPGNTHPGQGTANRRFFFSNAYLELLWVSGPAEAQSEPVRRTQLWHRWHHRVAGACPFGLVFRPSGDSEVDAPFPSWSYKPSYLPADLCIEVGSGISTCEPLLFYLPFARRRNRVHPEPGIHSAEVPEIVAICVSLPDSSMLSAGVRGLIDASLLRVRTAPDYLLELALHGDRTTPIDLRPDLPLAFVPASIATSTEAIRSLTTAAAPYSRPSGPTI
jgi:hypothetical protein